MEKLSLIDVTQEDDFLAPSPCGALIDPISPGNNYLESVIKNSDKDVCQEKFIKQVDEVLKLSESPEQNQTKPGKYNLRKSLAWDSAFFTSEGVLNHEELAIVNSTFKKTESRSLPMILEDVRKSSESTSTLDNDCWTLENLEVDLFDNVRASIQKSFGSDDKASRSIKPSKKINPALAKVESISNSKKKSPGLTEHDYENKSKEATVVLASSGKSNSKMLLKPPRVLPKATPPTKTTCVPGNSQKRNGTTRDIAGNTINQESLTSLKKINAGPSNVNLRSSQSLKPSLNLVNNSGDKAKKSSQDLTRMKSSRTINRSAGPISSKTSIRPSGAKIVCREKKSAAISSKSKVNLSLTASPSSSFDSVASGSSTSTIFGFKSVANSIEGSSPPSLEGAENDEVYLSGLKSGAISEDLGRSQERCKQSELSKVNHQESCTNTNIGAKCFKPSGLKVPTPKIGYFDANKSITFNAKTSQTRQQPSTFKSTTGVRKVEVANKLKPGKIQLINKAIPQDCSKFQTSAPFQNPSRETSSPEQLPMHLGSNNSIVTSKAHLEMSSIDKDFCSPKGHTPCKGGLEVVQDNNLDSALPKPTRKDLDSDQHPDHLKELSVSIDRSSSLGTKNADVPSYLDAQEADTQKSHHSDLPTITGKENVFPAQ
ncbi:uncharacterized protein LOC122043242 isoform X2 [Zingiber officinale]|uniref:uncharacterized protein LOC122043242 isoform X2 n=1 Tax=Zingiber officinale TaxID=94328 RepID=UPI001C4A9471|nr:uncharacterized protein LOC122043242 isoform X2 [Zingiber officinale]